MILVDSTKYISWMRSGKNPVKVLASLLRAGTAISCGVIRIEVLRGMIKPGPKAEMETLFGAIPEVPLDAGIISAAAEVAWQLDRRGIVRPVTDLLFAACAKRVGATIVSEDPHFQHIEGLNVLQELEHLPDV